PDESTPMSGPITRGPDLVEWARAVASGAAPARPTWVREEAARLQPWSYPTRRLQGVYYREQLEAILARGQVSCEAVLGTAVDLDKRGQLRVVRLDDGRRFGAPLV